MKEIVSLNVGDYGARVGSQFWRMISAEHGIIESGQLGCSSQDQVDGIEVFWEETTRGAGVTFRPRRVDVEAAERPGDSLERIRREVERCDTLQGFQLCHSMLESRRMIIRDIKEEYPCKIVNAYSIISQQACVQNIATLSDLKTYCDSVVLFDDKKIKDICRTQHTNMNIESDACHLVARVISDVTSVFRFPSPRV